MNATVAGRFLLLMVLVLGTAPDALACATCFGKSDSAMAQGMNMGILTLLGVIGSVLASITGFFVYLSRRSARIANAAENKYSSAV
jgi:hypothetical protein